MKASQSISINFGHYLHEINIPTFEKLNGNAAVNNMLVGVPFKHRICYPKYTKFWEM